MRLIPLISISLWLLSGGWVGAEVDPPADSSLPSTVGKSDAENVHSQASWYTNRSLIGTYRFSCIPGLSTDSARCGGFDTYDGQGHFEGHDQYSTFDGTYSVNPDGTGTATLFIRASVMRGQGGAQPLPVPLKYSGPLKIHPGGTIETEIVGPIGNGIGLDHLGARGAARVKAVWTQHKIDEGS